MIPAKAVIGGHLGDETSLYLGHAFHDDHMLPARITPYTGTAQVTFAGKSHDKQEFQYFIQRAVNIQWIPARDGFVPEGAIISGRMSNGEALYFTRIHRTDVNGRNEIIPGKVYASHGIAYYAYNGTELCSKEYEVLVEIQ